MSNRLGSKYVVQIFGQSHSPMIGAVIEGLPAGIVPDMEFIRAFMARRAPGGALSTARREADVPRIISGLNEGEKVWYSYYETAALPELFGGGAVETA